MGKGLLRIEVCIFFSVIGKEEGIRGSAGYLTIKMEFICYIFIFGNDFLFKRHHLNAINPLIETISLLVPPNKFQK